MAPSIESEDADRLARELARDELAKQLRRISTESARLPLLDARPEDELLGYDDHGMPL